MSNLEYISSSSTFWKNISVQFLVQMKTLNFALELNWPLVTKKDTNLIVQAVCIEQIYLISSNLKTFPEQTTRILRLQVI